MPRCHICTLAGSTDNLIVQTDHWRVILADDQAYLGRSFITLRSHKASLSELSPDEWLDFQQLVARIETGYEQAFSSGRPFNWACMMNNAFKNPSLPRTSIGIYGRDMSTPLP